MGALGDIAKSGASAAINSFTGGLGTTLISGLGKLFGSGGMSQEEIMKIQHQYELEKMGIQANYNKEQAAYTNQLQQQTWDYTNYENQVKHAKAAGLNPALLYGNGGGGGASTGGASAEGVSMGQSQAVAMGLQLKNQEAQIRLAESQATKNYAEASKISGVDTEKGRKEIDVMNSDKKLKEAQTNVQNTVAEVNKGTLKIQEANVEEIWSKVDLLNQQVREQTVKSDIAEETKDEMINKVIQESFNTLYAGVQAIANINLTEKQQKLIEETIKYYAYDQQTKRIAADAAKQSAGASEKAAGAAETTAKANEKNARTMAARVVGELKKWGAEIDIAREKVLQDWIYRGIEATTNSINATANVINALKPF